MAKVDLSKYKKLHITGLDFYIEQREDGTEILRYITIWNPKHQVEVPADGIEVFEEGDDAIRIKIGGKVLGG